MDDIFDNLDLKIVHPDFSPLTQATDKQQALNAIKHILMEHYGSSFAGGLENCLYPSLKAHNAVAVEAVMHAARRLSESGGYPDLFDRLKDRWRGQIMGEGLRGMLDTYVHVMHEGDYTQLWKAQHPDGRHALHAWMWMTRGAFEESLPQLRANGLPPVEVRLELLRDLKEQGYRGGGNLNALVKAVGMEEVAAAPQIDAWLSKVEEIHPAEGSVDLALLLCRPHHCLWQDDTTWANALINREDFPQATSHLVRTLSNEQFEKLEALWGRMGKRIEFEPFAQERHVLLSHEQLDEHTPDTGGALRARRI